MHCTVIMYAPRHTSVAHVRVRGRQLARPPPTIVNEAVHCDRACEASHEERWKVSVSRQRRVKQIAGENDIFFGAAPNNHPKCSLLIIIIIMFMNLSVEKRCRFVFMLCRGGPTEKTSIWVMRARELVKLNNAAKIYAFSEGSECWNWCAALQTNQNQLACKIYYILL